MVASPLKWERIEFTFFEVLHQFLPFDHQLLVGIWQELAVGVLLSYECKISAEMAVQFLKVPSSVVLSWFWSKECYSSALCLWHFFF